MHRPLGVVMTERHLARMPDPSNRLTGEAGHPYAPPFALAPSQP